MTRHELRYGLRDGKPSGWGFAMTSVGLGAVGVVAVLYALVVVLFRQHLPPPIANNPIPALGCLYWLIAPIGAAAGALVLDERLDVVRWGKVGLVLNLIAFCGALCVTFHAWRWVISPD